MKKVVLATLLLVFLSGCSAVQSLLRNELEDLPSGTVLFHDSFDNEKSGWKTVIEDGSYALYQADGLLFLIDQPNTDVWSSPGLDFEDVRIEVEAIKVSGPDDNAIGVLCRVQDEKNYYGFVISSDGYAGIYKVVNGEYTLLNSSSLEFSSAIHQGDAINYLSVSCNKNQLLFEVNGTNLFSIKDEQFERGDIGLITGSFEEPKVNVFFDNLTVFKP